MSSETAESGLTVGSIVAETYEVVQMLGRGGMGAVWEASHNRLPGKSVAIKVLHASVAEDPEALARFRREAEIACRLGHPNIVEVHDFNKLADGSPYLILELLEGTSLDAHLRLGALSVEECEAYLRQIAAALQCAHAQGVIHRDLKPQNIFLIPSPSGVGPAIVKVLDFGISKIRGSQTIQTQDSTLLGTPQYMAPEQAVGQHDSVDARTDIFALGAMLYELLSGKPAFGGQNIPEVVYKVVHVTETPLVELVPGIPPEKAAAVHKALNKAQDERFANVAEMVLAFTGVPLAADRPRRNSMAVRKSDRSLESAATVDSSKFDIAQAATVDSRKMDIAQAATIASQSTQLPSTNTASDLGSANTLAPSTLEHDATVLGERVPVAAAEQPDVTTKVSLPASVSKSAAPKWLIPVVGIALAGGVAAFAFGRSKEKAPAAEKELAVARVRIDAGGNGAAGNGAAGNGAMPAPAALDAAIVAIDAAPATPPDAAIVKRPPKLPENGKPSVREPQVPPEVEKLLAQAKADLKSGNLDKAIKTARGANRLKATTRGYLLQATAYCRRGDLPNFNGVLRKLPPARQRSARAACKTMDN